MVPTLEAHIVHTLEAHMVHTNKHKWGFTISEMLVALAVLGILGAVLTPVIRKIMPDQNKVMIKRSYYQVTNTVAKMLDDDTLYSPYGAVGSGNETTPIYSGFDNKGTVNFNGKNYSGNSKFGGIFSAILNPVYVGNETYSVPYEVTGGDSYSSDVVLAVTKDGIKWIFCTPTSGSSDIASAIIVDVNEEKGPNCFQGSSSCSTRVKDFDQYIVYVHNDGKISVRSEDAWVRSILNASSSINIE